VGWGCVSGYDLLSGGDWGTGAGTVSLLTPERELDPPTERVTYATYSLWLCDILYEQECVHAM